MVCGRGECDYTSGLVEHQRRQLDAGNDRWLTVNELVSAITAAGELVTGEELRGWINRSGLPREPQGVPRWTNGQLVADQRWTYRLSDVRDWPSKPRSAAPDRGMAHRLTTSR